MKNSQAKEKLTRRLKRLTKMQLFCTRAETSGGEAVGVQTFSTYLHLIITSAKGVGCPPSAQWEWTVFCLIALHFCTDMECSVVAWPKKTSH